MKIDIFDASDSGADDLDLSHIEIDANYARRLEHNKKREALDRLKELEKQGRAGASDDDSSASDDDDEAVPASTKEELDFIRALNIIKKKDPILKQPGVKLFNISNEDDAPRRVRRDKPLYLKDVNAQHLLEEGPEFEETPLKHDSKIYKEEQADSIRAFLEAGKVALEDGEDDDFIKQKETVGEDESADAEAEIEQELDNFFGKDVELDEGDKFLKQYLRERKWIDREKEKKVSIDVDVDVSEDENELERQDKYEASYNFRYQAPDQTDRVLGHSRVMEGSVRKKSSSRAVQRKSKEERMAQAEFERREELKHLKNLKKKEIQEKLERVRAIAGIGEGGVCKLDEDDLEEDFDPEEYDRKMKEMFDDDYYGENDADLEKPDFDNEEELLGFPDGLNEAGSKEGFAAARERFLKQKGEEDEEEPSERKRTGKVSLKEKVALEKELEEYYKLDYEDTIGDMKTRFKYKPVKANRFGLDPEEILLADDKNLNQYVSVKKLAPYREEEWETTYHQKKRKHEILQLDQVKLKKHDRSGGQRSSQVERKPENDQSDLSKRSKRRRRQNELKPSWTRLVAFGKRAAKFQKKH